MAVVWRPGPGLAGAAPRAWRLGWPAAALVLAALAVGWRHAGQPRRQAVAALPGLPPVDYHLPVVLLCGGGFAPGVHLRRHACYLAVAEAEALPAATAQVLAQRPHWGGRLSAVLVLQPDTFSDADALAVALRAWRYQLARARQQGAALPWLLASYLPGGEGEQPWFSGQGGALQVHEAGSTLPLARWQRQGAGRAEQVQRLQRAVQLLGLIEGLRGDGVPMLAGTGEGAGSCLPLAWAATWVPGLEGPSAGSLWQRWLTGGAPLALPKAAAGPAGLPFPDPLLALLPAPRNHAPRRRAGLIALWAFTAAALLSLASAAWHNLRMAGRLSDQVHAYLALPPGPEREAAGAALAGWAARLDHHRRHGPPPGLGFGFYCGETLRPWLLLPPATVPPAVAPAPQALSLNSLSRFNSGSAQLKAEATPVLVNALMQIQAQPGALVVIAGHTDARGDAQRNLALSFARARAVRDWLQQTGGLQGNCFAVQGFGASQPLHPNDSEHGRAGNRRVDIRLVPNAGACAPAATAPGITEQPQGAAAQS
ncbi:OmpA family protein [Pseudomonas sp. NPDC007930]|uniref:OmpA family protein n=1 Tax=Pseudomonas sp. NPDC007930 TaxID=3364417 RepID=UPI0036EBBA22